MILSPIEPGELGTALTLFKQALGPDAVAHDVFGRIAATADFVAAGVLEPALVERWHADAVRLSSTFGMRPLAALPQDHLSWDGCHVRTLSDPAVLLHEIAHFQIVSPARRFLPDFGMGAGPESGAVDLANKARRLHGPDFEAEEQMTSLLGILWEVELGQAAILAFQEQNWLEGAGRPSTALFFRSVLHRLIEAQLADRQGRPRLALNCRSDERQQL